MYQTLKCLNTNNNYGGLYKLKIGLLSIDEYVFAGQNFMDKDGYGEVRYNYLFNIHYSLTISPSNFQIFASSASIMYSTRGRVDDGGTLPVKRYVFPSINLKANTQIIGEGTSSNPYTVN